jgi:hypothetical protein
MHEPAGTEPGRKTAGTAVILARDTISAVALTSWKRPDRPFDASGNRVPPGRPVLRGGGPDSCVMITEAFVPDLAAPERPFRPGLRVQGVAVHLGVFEIAWDNDGWATFSYGGECVPGQPHVIWRRPGTHAIFTPPPGP